MENKIGIDFGTTKTMVSYFNPATNRVELVRLGRDRDSIPTTIHVDKSGIFLFGEDADDRIEEDPEGYCRAFKMHLGEKEFVVPRSAKTAEAITVEFLKYIKNECEQLVFHQEPVTAATITIPISFSPARKASLRRAANSAGFTKVDFVPEPEAAGIAFLRDNPRDKFSRALVLDWGGGTLDIAIISRGEDGEIRADRLSAEGCEGMGGEEIDIGLLQNIAAMWESAYGAPLIQDEAEEVRFLRVTQKVKELLSKKDPVSFRRGTKKQEISREKFNHIISELLGEVVRLVASALAKNKSQGNPDPDALILIGGSCQIPAVRQAMEQNFPNLRVLSWHHSHEAVALGATWSGSKQTCLDEQSIADEVPKAQGTLPIKQQRCWKSGAEFEAYLRERKTLHEDYLHLWRSMIVVMWRMNAVQTSALAFAGELEKIGENEDSKVVSLRVRQGLSAVELGEFDSMVNVVADSVAEMIKEGTGFEGYIELYPELKSIPVRTAFSDMDVQSIKYDVSNGLRQLRNIFDDVNQKYNMLCEGFARYDKIMAGSSFWKNALLGGALGLLTGGIGVIAAVAWSGWGHMNDKDFLQNYSNAIQDFLATCDAFTDQGQKLFSQIVMSRQDSWNQAFIREATYLRTLNDRGVDLDGVDKRLKDKSMQKFQNEPNAMEMIQAIAIAIDVLKQDAPISAARIGKIVEDLRKEGLLLSVDGTVDEAAAQTLVPTEAGGDDVADRLCQIVGACRHFDCFYILDAIPRDKLVNALHDYGSGLREENVLCLYDSTFFGGGGDGFMVAPGGICSKQLGCDPCAWTWGEIRNICPNVNGRVVQINGIEVDVPYGGASEFAEMFRQLKNLFGEV